MGKEDSRKIETEAAAPCPAPAWIKLGVCLTGCSAKKKKMVTGFARQNAQLRIRD